MHQVDSMAVFFPFQVLFQLHGWRVEIMVDGCDLFSAKLNYPDHPPPFLSTICVYKFDEMEALPLKKCLLFRFAEGGRTKARQEGCLQACQEEWFRCSQKDQKESC
jgi:hypothetical protein